jgi:hypothetical protein
MLKAGFDITAGPAAAGGPDTTSGSGWQLCEISIEWPRGQRHQRGNSSESNPLLQEKMVSSIPSCAKNKTAVEGSSRRG